MKTGAAGTTCALLALQVRGRAAAARSRDAHAGALAAVLPEERLIMPDYGLLGDQARVRWRSGRPYLH